MNEALAVEAETGRWPSPRAGGLPPDFSTLHGAVHKLRSRVFDDELRRLASEIVEEATHFIVAYSQEQRR